MKLLYERWRRFLSEAEVEEGIDPNTNQHDGRYYAFDWDDNLLFMPTEIYFNIVGTTTEVGVSTHKFAEIRELIGKPGKYKDYSFSTGSFRDFRVEGDQKFLEDVKAGPKTSLAWKDFVECLNSASVFAIITARGHTPSILKDAVKILIDKNYQGIDKAQIEISLARYDELTEKDKVSTIDEYLNLCKFYPVSYVAKGSSSAAADPSAAKVKALREFHSYVDELDEKMGVHATGKPTLGFSDDDPGNIELIKDKFKDTKLVVKFTGHVPNKV